MNYVEKHRNQIKKNIVASYIDPRIEIAMDFLEKGKKANLGEVREWQGQKMQKTTTGWKPVGEGKKESSSKLKPGDEGEFTSWEGEPFSYRVYSDGWVKMSSPNVRKDFETIAQAEAFIAKEITGPAKRKTQNNLKESMSQGVANMISQSDRDKKRAYQASLREENAGSGFPPKRSK